MTRYRDPQAPKGRVVFGGEAFHDGLTADITPGPETRKLFAAAGIHAEKDAATPKPDVVEVAEPAPKPKK